MEGGTRPLEATAGASLDARIARRIKSLSRGRDDLPSIRPCMSIAQMTTVHTANWRRITILPPQKMVKMILITQKGR